MTTSVLPAFNTFEMAEKQIKNLSSDDLVSLCSENENRREDYSLSDIEEGLDAKSIASWNDLSALENFRSNGDLTMPVKVCRSSPLTRRAFIRDDEEEREGKTDLKSGSWLRRRAFHLNVKQETAKQGAMEISRRITSKSSASSSESSQCSDENVSIGSSEEAAFMPESDLCASPVRTPSLKSDTVGAENTPDAKILPSITVSANTDDFVSRQRSQTLSGPQSPPTCRRTRSSSLMIPREAKMNLVKLNSSPSSTTAALKKLKHYQRALEAYRRSAEKAREDRSDSTCYAYSLPLRGARKNVFEKDSMFNFMSSKINYSSPEGDDRVSESDKSTYHSSNSGESVANEDLTAIRRWPFVPMTGDVRSKFGEEDSLDIDYRSALRYHSLKRTKNAGSKISQESRDRIRSLDPEIVTDIDVIVGFPSKNDGYSPSGSDKSSQESINSLEPEKIVWPGYEKYLRAKSDPSRFPRSSLKMRLAAMEKKGIDSRPLEALERQESTPRSPQHENPYVNLRDNQIIRKRNLSRSNPSTFQSSQLKIPLILPSLTVPATGKYHTVASPGRSARILYKRRTEEKLSPVSSPAMARQHRAFSLSIHTNTDCICTKKSDKASQQACSPSSSSDSNAIDVGLHPSGNQLKVPTADVQQRQLPHNPPKTSLKTASSAEKDDASVKKSRVETNALFLSNYKSVVTPTTSNIYDYPRSYKLFKHQSTISSLLNNTHDSFVRQHSQDTTTSVTYSFAPSSALSSVGAISKPRDLTSNAFPSKTSSLECARAIATGHATSNFTPGNYPTINTDSDSEDDYVNFDHYYKEKVSPKKVAKPKRKQLSRSVADISVAVISQNPPEDNQISNSRNGGKSTSRWSLASETFKSIKRTKKIEVSQSFSNVARSIASTGRSVSALDIFNIKLNGSTRSVAKIRRTFLSGAKRGFSSSDLFYGIKNKQSRKNKQKLIDISVPLTDIMNEPSATHNLTLRKDARKDDTVRRFSKFLNKDSLQNAKLSECLESKTKANHDKKTTTRLLSGVTRALNLRKTGQNSGNAQK